MFPSNMDDKGRKARYESAEEDQTYLVNPDSRNQHLQFNEDISSSPAPNETWGSDTKVRGEFNI